MEDCFDIKFYPESSYSFVSQIYEGIDNPVIYDSPMDVKESVDHAKKPNNVDRQFWSPERAADSVRKSPAPGNLVMTFDTG